MCSGEAHTENKKNEKALHAKSPNLLFSFTSDGNL
jgi:hypothetical protein